MSTRRLRGGSTLVELLVVLAVLGVLLTVVTVAAGGTAPPLHRRDWLRVRAVDSRIPLTVVDSAGDARVLRREEPTGLSLVDSAGTMRVGVHR